MSTPELSVVIVSFNTREILRECLETLAPSLEGIPSEVFVVDNHSRDGSAEMVAELFPHVRLLRSEKNLGFGGANNVALELATGRYIVLLNSDAFVEPTTMRRAIEHMDSNPRCGLGGGMLVGRDGAMQPSARVFHSIAADFFQLSGLAQRFPKSKTFAGLEGTWFDPNQARKVDWVPGAFSVIRRTALEQVGFFDPRFFLYYEEVDLCRRIIDAGWDIWYWPDLRIIHIGGESSRSLAHLDFSPGAAQVTLWRMRSTLLYYRKHHGAQARLARALEEWTYRFSEWRNRIFRRPDAAARIARFQHLRSLMSKAWEETKGGRISPPTPW